jgi:hypothetical protein
MYWDLSDIGRKTKPRSDESDTVRKRTR